VPTRRRCLLGLGATALALAGPARGASPVPDWSLRAQQRLLGRGDGDIDERQRLLAEGEARLAAGSPAEAEPLFDRAALILHAADSEIALVRTYMQQGQYRKALAFCAHTAGVHRDVVAAAGLYVWLLHLGGQTAVAARRLAEAQAQYPGEALLAAVDAEIRSGWPQARGLLRRPPSRLAPYAAAGSPSVPAHARGVGSATLLPDGQHALAPLQPLSAADAGCWLRNALGQASAAHRVGHLPELGLQLLRLRSPWTPLQAAGLAARDPFAGQAGYTLEFSPADDAEPAWPLLRLGFLGAVGREAGTRRLGLDTPPGPRGGPVLDGHGQWVGVAVPSTRLSPAPGLVQASELRAALGDLLGPAAAPLPRVAPDEAYERGLQLALQLLV
jgi:hypothetical protein